MPGYMCKVRIAGLLREGVSVRAAYEVCVELTVNGAPRAATVPARTLLVHFLRDRLRLTGTHVGCDTTQCGACTVALDGVAVKSCTVLAAQAHGHEVTTVEGLAEPGTGSLHPVQQAFQDEHGLQCGYCTPGMVLAVRQLLQDQPDPTEDQVRHALDGNICRCTGYQNIVAAALRAARSMRHGTGPSAAGAGAAGERAGAAAGAGAAGERAGAGPAAGAGGGGAPPGAGPAGEREG
jgi:carbon-monoxide dehydrogenase small subunit